MAKKVKIIVPIIIVLVVTVITTLVILSNNAANDNVINKGVTINGLDVGGMTKADAAKMLNDKFNSKLKEKTIRITHEKRVFLIDYKSLNAHYDVTSAVDKAFSYGKDGNFITKALRNMGIGSSSYNVELNFLADTSIVDKVVQKIGKKLYKAPTDAKAFLANGEFKIVPEKNGSMVDEKSLSDMIKNSIKPDEGDTHIQVPIVAAEAHVKADMLSKIGTEIASFTTAFRASDAARSGNIRIAASAVDGTVILPGETFSMNDAVGPRIASKGYQEAHVIVNGELVDGLAGGICQVTTTLYNAALLSNFKIVARRPHQLKVAYVSPGRDATISGDYIDMKFKNTNKTPIYIHTYVKGGTITAKIFGVDEHPNQSVEIETEVLERIQPQGPEYINDPTLPVGTKKVEQKPIQGVRSITYRKVYEGDKLVKTETLSKDKYKPARARILVGTKKKTSKKS